jgi:hypothetical protein
MGATAGAWFRMFCAVGFVFFLCACAADPVPQLASERKLGSNHESYVPGEYIVTAHAHVDIGSISRVYEKLDTELVKSLGSGRFLLRLKRDPGIDRVRTLGVESGLVEAVQPNYVYRSR